MPAVKGTVSPSDIHPFTLEGRERAPHEEGADDGSPHLRHGGGRVSGVDLLDHGEASYALYLYVRKEARVVRLREATALQVEPLGFELATFSRIRRLARPWKLNGEASSESLPAQAVLWAPVGLVEMMNSSAALCAQEVLDARGVEPGPTQGDALPGPAVVCLVKGSGRFMALANRQPARVTLEASAGNGKDEPLLELEVGISRSVSGGSEAQYGQGREGNPPAKKVGEVDGMLVIEVNLPGPWHGRERRLHLYWD